MRIFTRVAGLLLLASLFLLNHQAHAQDRIDVTGYVKDEAGNPLAGVTVVRRSSESGTSTDDKGFFSIKVANANVSLVFSSVGYTSQTVKVNTTAPMNIVLQRTVTNQEEVVIIGYGSAKRKDVTGAVATLKPKAADAQQFNTVDNLMKGRVAGVEVQQSAGDPGGSVSVKIRGINSLRGDNEPLYVVDGVIINNVTNDAGDPFKSKSNNSGQTAQSGLAGINPLDIESIEILKDASATAIYGSRGANGVVIITTRQGTGKPVIRYTTFVEAARATKKLKVLDARGYASYINEYEASQGRNPKYGLDTLQDINWQDALQRTGFSTNNRLSITGSSQDNKSKYFLAGGFLDNKGIVLRSGFKQGDVKLNFSQVLSNRLRMNFTLSSVFLKNSMTQGTEALGGGDNSFIVKMLVAKPILNAQTDLTDPSLPYDNPYSWLQDYDDFSEE